MDARSDISVYLAVRQDNRGSRIDGYLDCQLKRIRFYPPVRADGTVQGLIRSAAINEAAHRLRSNDNVLHTRLRFIITDSGKCPVNQATTLPNIGWQRDAFPSHRSHKQE